MAYQSRALRSFSLPESLLAVLILCFAALSLGYAISVASAQALEARQRALATFLAKRQLDAVVKDGYGGLAGTFPTIVVVDGFTFSHQVTVGSQVTHTFPLVGVTASGRQVTAVVRIIPGNRELARLAEFVYAP